VRVSRFLPQIVRAGGAAALDYRFDRRSPLPALDARAFAQLSGDAEVVLPPLSWAAPGNQSYVGLTFLVTLGRILDAQRVFEIGTYNGATAWCLARNLHAAEVHTLDLPIEQDPALPYGVGDASNRIAFERRAYDVLPLSDSLVVQHWGDSASFDFRPWQRSIDLVYVDGAHSHDYVRKDSETAFSLVGESGAIVWDDYSRRIPGVRAVLNERQEPLLRVPGTRVVLYLASALRAALGL